MTQFPTIAVLMTCHNRREKTLRCLSALFSQKTLNIDYAIQVFLVDDGSTDRTGEEVQKNFPEVVLMKGDGNLFWAGGMRHAWRSALNNNKDFDFFLLLNDDTILFDDAFVSLFSDVKLLKKKEVILIGPTKDLSTGEFTYGGRILKNKYSSANKIVDPTGKIPKLCDLGNANIMLVSKDVVGKIGILSEGYTHSYADYDYTLKAKKVGILSYTCSVYCGACADDHGPTWKNSKRYSLKQRIAHLYSVKGLAYNEYLKFIRTYFPLYLPQAWLLLWLKTVFPFLWERHIRPQS